jgi:cytochrome c
MSRLGAALVAPALLAACASASDPQQFAEGERQFQRCYACHSLDPADKGLQGPPLAGIIGRRAGTAPNFEYSPAMRAARSGGLVWTPDILDRFIADPDAVVRGTSMSPTGMVRAADRAALIAYLAAAGP